MKKLACLLLVGVMVLTLAGCGVEIEDTNGAEDYSLATITEQNIIDMDLGSSSYSESTSSLSSRIKYKGNDFSGVAEIYNTNILMGSLTIDVTSLEVTEGNFALVVLKDDVIVGEFAVDEESQSITIDDAEGYITIRIAGESADFQFNMEVW